MMCIAASCESWRRGCAVRSARNRSSYACTLGWSLRALRAYVAILAEVVFDTTYSIGGPKSLFPCSWRQLEVEDQANGRLVLSCLASSSATGLGSPAECTCGNCTFIENLSVFCMCRTCHDRVYQVRGYTPHDNRSGGVPFNERKHKTTGGGCLEVPAGQDGFHAAARKQRAVDRAWGERRVIWQTNSARSRERPVGEVLARGVDSAI